jgi:hypothetical protein
MQLVSSSKYFSSVVRSEKLTFGLLGLYIAHAPRQPVISAMPQQHAKPFTL